MNDSLSPSRLRYFTPLRYPGGKGRLAPYLKAVLEANNLLDGEYVEPYAGGAAVALELLFHEYVSCIRINDLSVPVFAFWHCVLNETEALVRLVRDTSLTVAEWDRQRTIFRTEDGSDLLSLGFAFFYLNRTNRSGILNGGVIGGRQQTGHWKIDARYNAKELIARIEAIARLGSRIHLTNLDAVSFLEEGRGVWSTRTIVYCDPPYYVKGRDLYYHFYEHVDHARVADQVTKLTRHWVVSYDNVPEIHALYAGFRHIAYDIGYSARNIRQGSEVMFFSPHLDVPKVVGAISETARVLA